MKKIAVLSMLLLVLGLAPEVQAYSFTTYTSYVDFLNAVKTIKLVVENFEDTTLESGFSITTVGGIGTIKYGVYENYVDKDVPSYQTFNYAPGMVAFGGWFDLKNPGGSGTGINVYINDDNTYVMSIGNTADGQFYGFVADATFYGVRLADPAVSTSAAIRETYFLVDAALATHAPIPPSMLLFAPALLSLIGLRKRS